MKKHYYFMNKPEIIETDNENKKKEVIQYYSKIPDQYYKNILIDEDSYKKRSYSKIYFIQFILLFISFFIYINYYVLKEDSKGEANQESKSLFYEDDKNFKIIDDKLKYIFKKIADKNQMQFIFVVQNIHHEAIKIDTILPVKYIIYTNTKEILDKGEKIEIKKSLKPYDQIHLISLKIDHSKIEKEEIQKVGIEVNKNFTLYLSVK